MANYTSRYDHRDRRRRKRTNPLFLITLLVGILAVLLVVALIISIPRVTLYGEQTVEAGAQLPNAQSYLQKSNNKNIALSYAQDYSALLSQPGEHKVTIQWNGGSQEVTLRVVDTVAPKGETKDLLARPEQLPKAEDFLKSFVDATAVTVAYETAPDAAKTQQVVSLLLTDAAGNTTRLNANLTLDSAAPVISGTQNLVAYQGCTVAYRNGITVSDDLDTAPTWQVDSSKVDLSTPGEYPLVYTATDAAGNEASVTVTVTVLVKKDDYVELDVIYDAVDKLLAEIITPDMDLYRQVHKVYYWVRTNCTYSSAYHEKDDWRQRGYEMLTGGYGDCFYYFGLCKLMLERLGIPNIDVKKVPNYEGDSMHYWHLVSIDGGKTYYHVDTTPRTVATYFCLVTDKEMDDFSASYRNCFNRDKSLYPATPTERPR